MNNNRTSLNGLWSELEMTFRGNGNDVLHAVWHRVPSNTSSETGRGYVLREVWSRGSEMNSNKFYSSSGSPNFFQCAYARFS
jgi:hypothetical protein